MRTVQEIYDQTIDTDLPGEVALKVKRGIEIVMSPASRDHVAACLSQLMQVMYYRGRADAAKDMAQAIIGERKAV